MTGGSDQLTLALGVLAHDADAPADLTIQQAFVRFHTLNPWVYTALETLTTDWLARGRTRIGIGMLTEVLRWQYARQTVGSEFKLNNNFRSRYVRLLVEQHPEWEPVFETRVLRSA